VSTVRRQERQNPTATKTDRYHITDCIFLPMVHTDPQTKIPSIFLVGRQEGHLACRNLVLVIWWRLLNWSFACLLAPVVSPQPHHP